MTVYEARWVQSPALEQNPELYLFEFHQQEIMVLTMPEKPTYEELEQRVLALEKAVFSHKNVKECLLSNEDHFKTFFMNAPMPYQSLDENGNLIEVNETFLSVLGYSREELIGRNFNALLHPDWIEYFNANFLRLVAAGEISGVEFEMLKKDGSAILASFNGKVQHDDEGHFLRTHCIFQDITERRQAENTLKESETRFRTIFEQAAIGVALTESQTGRLIRINQRYCNMVGYTLEEMSEKKTFQEITHPGDLQADLDNMAKILAGEIREFTLEKRYIHKNGSIVWVNLTVSPTWRPGEEPRYHIAVVEDITERKNAEKALRESERKYRELIELSPVGIFKSNSDGRIVFVNPKMTRILGADSHQEVIDKYQDLNRDLYIDPDRRNEFIELIKDKGGVENFEYEARSLKGKRIWLSVNAKAREKLSDGTLIIDGFATNITERKQAEKALRDSEEKYRILFENANDAIFIHDKQARMLAVNMVACEQLGYTHAELMTLTVQQINSPEEAEKVRVRMSKLMEQGYLTFETNHVSKDGSFLPTEVSSRRITWDGRPAIMSICRDISERKRAEDALLNENKIIDAILESSPGILYLYNDQAKLVRWNKKHELMTGYSSEELYGKDILDWFKGDDASLSAVKEYLKNTFEKGFGEIEADLQRKDGSKIPMFLTASSLTIDDKPYFVGIGIDITERKRTDEERILLSSVIEQAEENVLITDDRRTILYINPAFERSSGYTCDEIKGKKLKTLRSDQHDEDFYQEAKKILDQGKVWMGVIINRGKNGTSFEIEGTISPIRNTTGSITHYVAVGRNMSRFRRMERELQQLQKLEALGTLAGGIAHDFNNVLSAIMGYIELELLGASEGSKTSIRMKHAYSACCRARDLIKQILAFSRQSGQQLKPIKIAPIIMDAVQMLRATLPTTIDIRLTMKEAHSVILGDLTQLHQIIVNLCTNAAHAMRDKGGILEIGVYNADIDDVQAEEYLDLKPGSYVQIAVTDTGHGMDSKTLEQIFDPFFTTKGPGEGSGIGLSVVHGIVKSYGGMIAAHSEIGKGSSFEIFFPRIEVTSAVPDAGSTAELPTGSERILFVDDEEMIVTVTTEMLKNLGYEVVPANRGLEALQLFKTNINQFHLVITDLTMPDMTGIELAYELLRIQSDIPIILGTGFISKEVREKAKSTGILEIIMKPFNLNKMAETVRRVLDESKKPNQV